MYDFDEIRLNGIFSLKGVQLWIFELLIFIWKYEL